MQDQPLLNNLLSEDIQNKIIAGISTLAEKLGVAASHVYEVLVRQAFYEGLTASILIGVLLLGLLCLGLFFWFYVTPKIESDDNRIAANVFFVMALAFGLGISGYHLNQNLVKIFNPEYYAIKTILEAVK